jgi:hypothetical protein
VYAEDGVLIAHSVISQDNDITDTDIGWLIGCYVGVEGISSFQTANIGIFIDTEYIDECLSQFTETPGATTMYTTTEII